MKSVEQYFPSSYLESRTRFLGAVKSGGYPLISETLHDYRGAQGETLTTDATLIGSKNPENVLVVTSGTHGVEGFCGAGCQMALMDDEILIARATEQNLAFLLIHAVNPFGFSHLRRQNEENIDLNRNCVDFSLSRDDIEGLDELDALMIPADWPPSDENEKALSDLAQRYGPRRFRQLLASGQYQKADGMYYGGKSRTWSLSTVKKILEVATRGVSRLAWLDVHTGLGRPGHCEKIFAGRDDPAELARAQKWWGLDVLSLHGEESMSSVVSGAAVNVSYELDRFVQATHLALEYGTVEQPRVRTALRAEQWLFRNPATPAAKAYVIKKALLDAFYRDEPGWKGMILGQFRISVLQTLMGMELVKNSA